MKILAFDTSANSCSIILKENEKTIAAFNEELNRGQAELLIPAIDNLLRENNLTMKEIDLIAVCNGAGSFTGIRASISAARAFGISLNIPVLGVSSFEIYNSLLNEEEKTDCNLVIVESKRDDFYYALYDREGNELEKPQAAYYDDIMARISGKSVAVIGDGTNRFIGAGENLHIHSKKQEKYPSVEALANIAFNKYNQNKAGIDRDIRSFFPSPLYIRAPYVFGK